MSCSISKWQCGRPARQNHRHQPTLPTLDSEATKDGPMTHWNGLCCSRVHFPESRASPLQQQAKPSLRTLCTTHQCGLGRWPAGFTLVRATKISRGTVHILLNGAHEELGNNQTVLWNKCFPDGMLRCCFPVDSNNIYLANSGL